MREREGNLKFGHDLLVSCHFISADIFRVTLNTQRLITSKRKQSALLNMIHSTHDDS